MSIPAQAAYAYRHLQTAHSYAPYSATHGTRTWQVRRPFGAAMRPYGRSYVAAPAYRSAYRPAVRPRVAVGGGGGLATFYDPGWRGRGFTAAHLSLPMGTHIMVTNLSNRRSVMVRIADRGPQAWTGRVLDLSRTAAASLGMIQSGVVPVSYRVVN